MTDYLKYNALPTGSIRVFTDLWRGAFIRLIGDILEILVFKQPNNSNDALRASAHPMVLTKEAHRSRLMGFVPRPQSHGLREWRDTLSLRSPISTP